MKIKIINPDYGMTAAEMNERCNILKMHVSTDTVLDMDCLRTSCVYIDSTLDIVLAGAEIVAMAKKAEADGFDAVVLYCFSDPAVAACREVVSIPVIGGGQAAYLTALLLGRHFGVIITEKKRIGEKKLFVHETGVAAERVAGIRAVDFCGKQLHEDIPHTISCLEKTAALLIEDGAQVVILGCLSFLGMSEELSKRIGIPVVDAAIAAVTMAECMVRQNLKTSKLSYAVPPCGTRTWTKGKFIV